MVNSLQATQSELNNFNNLFSKKDHKEALAELDLLTQKYPNDPNLFLFGGNCYVEMGHFNQAILCYEEAIKLNPDLVDAHNNMGICLKEIGEIEKAVISFKNALKLKPDYAMAHNNLGICLYDLSQSKEAQLCYKRAIKLKPDYAEPHSNLGNILKDLGNVDEAILSYQKAIKLNPDFIDAYNNLGSIFNELGRNEEAVKCWGIARGGNKDYEKGLEMLEKKNFSEAIKNFEISNFGDWQEKVLECHYRAKEFDKFKEKLPKVFNGRRHNIRRLASISANYAQNFKIKDPYNFCPSPLDFVCHEEIPELSKNKGELIKELIHDINTAGILKRKYQYLFNDSPVEQSAGHLFRRSEKSFKKLSDALIKAIEKYFLRYKDVENEFILSFPKKINFISAWYIKMQSSGHLTAHIHEDGWISGAVYLKIPKNSGSEDYEGAIELSADGDNYPRLHEEFKRLTIIPKAGEVIFFPSSVFHRTIPFNSEEERICIAFDVKPGF